MEYNTQREKLVLPEYGRYIHELVNYCCSLTDRDERNICARAIVQVMGNMKKKWNVG